jgi:hypothetical protein
MSTPTDTQTATTEATTEASAGAATESQAAAKPSPDMPAFEREIAEAVAAAEKLSADGGQAPAPSEKDHEEPAGGDGTEPAAGEPSANDNGDAAAATQEPAVEEPAKPARLTQQLAAMAREKRAIETRAKELDAVQARIKEDQARIAQIRNAPNRPAMLVELLGGADQVRELFVELSDWVSGEESAPSKPTLAKPAGPLDLAKLVAEEVAKARQADRDAEAAEVAKAKAAYSARALEVLEQRGMDFPLTFAAPPETAAIAAMSEEILEATGSVPTIEQLLGVFEHQRTERRKKLKPRQTTGTTPAPAKQPTTTSGAQPIRRNSAPVVPARQTTFDEEVAAAVAAAARAQ